MIDPSVLAALLRLLVTRHGPDEERELRLRLLRAQVREAEGLPEVVIERPWFSLVELRELVFVGDRGAGKSAAAEALADLWVESGYARVDVRRGFAFGEVPDRTLVVVDEGALVQGWDGYRALSARARHRDVRLVCCAQSASWVPPDVLRLATIVHRRPAAGSRFDRPELVRDLERVSRDAELIGGPCWDVAWTVEGGRLVRWRGWPAPK